MNYEKRTLGPENYVGEAIKGAMPSQTASVQEKPMVSALNELEYGISRLHEDIMFLSGRLEPVRSSCPPSVKPQTDKGPRAYGSLTAFIVEQTQRLDEIHRQVANLTQELDI